MTSEREHSPLGEVSLFSWSPVLQDQIQLLFYIKLTTCFLFFVKSSLVKQETSCIAILPPYSEYSLHQQSGHTVSNALQCEQAFTQPNCPYYFRMFNPQITMILTKGTHKLKLGTLNIEKILDLQQKSSDLIGRI